MNTHKDITTFDSICLGVNAIIGSGIFIFPAILFREAGTASISIFSISCALLIFVALCYAELGSMYDTNGGSYVYAREAFGLDVGFMIGWISWLTSVFSWAAVAQATTYYAGFLYPPADGPVAAKVIAACIIGALAYVNYRGVKPAIGIINAFSIIKVIPLIVFIVLGFFYFRHTAAGMPHIPVRGSYEYAVFLSLWTLQGFETVAIPSGESRRPQFSVPVAVVGSLVFSACLYTLVQAASVMAGPDLASSVRPLADTAAAMIGPPGGVFIAAGAVISMLGYTAGNALGSPLFLAALARDGFLPARLARPHTRFFTPSWSILITGCLTMAAALALDFEGLACIASITVVIQYFSTCAALIRLRRIQPEVPRFFKIRHGRGVALVGCLVSLWLLQQVSVREAACAGIIIMLGFCLRRICVRYTPRRSFDN